MALPDVHYDPTVCYHPTGIVRILLEYKWWHPVMGMDQCWQSECLPAGLLFPLFSSPASVMPSSIWECCEGWGSLRELCWEMRSVCVCLSLSHTPLSQGARQNTLMVKHDPWWHRHMHTLTRVQKLLCFLLLQGRGGEEPQPQENWIDRIEKGESHQNRFKTKQKFPLLPQICSNSRVSTLFCWSVSNK